MKLACYRSGGLCLLGNLGYGGGGGIMGAGMGRERKYKYRERDWEGG